MRSVFLLFLYDLIDESLFLGPFKSFCQSSAGATLRLVWPYATISTYGSDIYCCPATGSLDKRFLSFLPNLKFKVPDLFKSLLLSTRWEFSIISVNDWFCSKKVHSFRLIEDSCLFKVEKFYPLLSNFYYFAYISVLVSESMKDLVRLLNPWI